MLFMSDEKVSQISDDHDVFSAVSVACTLQLLALLSIYAPAMSISIVCLAIAI